MQARQRDGRTPASADDRGGSLRGMLGARPSQRSESLRERSADLSKDGARPQEEVKVEGLLLLLETTPEQFFI